MEKRNNYVLIGFMGCGKTSVGMRLSAASQYQFYDTDQMIEDEYGASIGAIFEREGEEAFRRMETAVLKRLSESISDSIISTGGGVPLRAENREYLKKIGTVIFLKSSRETTIARLAGDTTRPLLFGDGVEEKVDKLLSERIPCYEEVADHVVVTDNRSFYDIMKEIELMCGKK